MRQTHNKNNLNKTFDNNYNATQYLTTQATLKDQQHQNGMQQSKNKNHYSSTQYSPERIQNPNQVTSQTLAQNQSILYGTQTSTIYQPKAKGFVDFDLQLNRPEISGANAHEKRFLTYNMFPPSHSKTKHSPQILFDKCLSRNDKLYKMNMSEVVFDKDKAFVDPRVRPKGILHFSWMHCNQLPEHQMETEKIRKHRAKINKLSGINQQQQQNSSLSTGDLESSKFHSATHYSDLKSTKGFLSIDKQYPRINSKTDSLPLYMQNINNRMGMTNILGKGLVDNNYMDQDFKGTTVSTLYLKKEFRVDPKTKKRVNSIYNQDQTGDNQNQQKKKSLTFNQLLAKYGYIEDESMTKKVRVRDWHIKKITNEDSDTSSNE
eukprot:403341574